MRLRIIPPDGAAAERDVNAGTIRLGRDPACELAFDAKEYPQVSGLHARLEQTAEGLLLTPLSRSNKTLLNDQPVDGPVIVKLGDRIRLGFTGPSVELLVSPGVAGKSAERSAPPRPPSAAPPPDSGTAIEPVQGPSATVQAAPEHLGLLRGSLGAKPMPLGQGGVIGRERA